MSEAGTLESLVDSVTSLADTILSITPRASELLLPEEPSEPELGANGGSQSARGRRISSSLLNNLTDSPKEECTLTAENATVERPSPRQELEKSSDPLPTLEVTEASEQEGEANHSTNELTIVDHSKSEDKSEESESEDSKQAEAHETGDSETGDGSEEGELAAAEKPHLPESAPTCPTGGLSDSKDAEHPDEHQGSEPVVCPEKAVLEQASLDSPHDGSACPRKEKEGSEPKPGVGGSPKRNLRKAKAMSGRSKGEPTAQGLQNYHDLRRHFEAELAEMRKHYDSEIAALHAKSESQEVQIQLLVNILKNTNAGAQLKELEEHSNITTAVKQSDGRVDKKYFGLFSDKMVPVVGTKSKKLTASDMEEVSKSQLKRDREESTSKERRTSKLPEDDSRTLKRDADAGTRGKAALPLALDFASKVASSNPVGPDAAHKEPVAEEPSKREFFIQSASHFATGTRGVDHFRALGIRIVDDKLAGLTRPALFRLYCENIGSSELLELLLLIHQSFIEAHELLLGLMDLYHTLENEEHKLMIIYNFKYWAEGNSASFNTVVKELKEFRDDLGSSDKEIDRKCSINLKKLVDNFLMRGDVLRFEFQEKTASHAPEVLLDKKLWGKDAKFLSLFKIPPLEFARQFTLLEFGLLKKIPLSELCLKRFDKKDLSPNITAYANLHKMAERWIRCEIFKTSVDDAKKRSKIISYLLDIAEKFQQIQNYSGMSWIIFSLSDFEIKMSKTKQLLSENDVKRWAMLEKLSTPPFKDLKHLINAVQPPMIPLLAPLFRDLTFIEEYFPETWKQPEDEESYLDMNKMFLIGKTIKILHDSQNEEYIFKSMENIQSYLSEVVLCGAEVPDATVEKIFKFEHVD